MYIIPVSKRNLLPPLDRKEESAMKLIALMKDGKPRTACGLPLMMLENGKGKVVKPQINLVDYQRKHHDKPYTKNVPVDIRAIPVSDEGSEFGNWLEANDMENCVTALPIGDEFVDAALVVVIAPNFLPFIHSNEKYAIRSVYYSILCNTDYADHAEDLVLAAMNDMGIRDKNARHILLLYAHEASRCFNGSIPGAQGDTSVIQYNATMLAIASYICGCSPKDMILSDYKIMGPAANQMLKDIKKAIKAK